MKHGKKIHPYMIIILSFISVILFGTVLLLLPWASTKYFTTGETLSFVDALFMSTSAVCVTGLATVNVASGMTVYGKIVMAILMEIGGLSFITIAVFFFTMLGAKIGISNRFLLRESLNQSSIKGIISLVKKIILISFIIQIVCAAINLIPIMRIYNNDFWKSLGVSLFHSAASFNNAGFDVFGSDSMIPYTNDLILNATTMVMIVLGGIGFVVIDDVLRNRRWSRFSLHTKLTLVSTVIFILAGMFILKLTCQDVSYETENGNVAISQGMTWLESLFTSVTCRTAGFATYDMSQLSHHPAAYMVCIFLMFVGASPCSTGGGVKTTSVVVIFLAIFYFARGKKTRAFKRKISEANLFKAFVLIVVGILIDVVGAFLVSAIQPEFTFQEVVFEVVSAFSTTGLSMGITGSLNIGNKLIICILMTLGRIGPLTIIGVVNKNWMSASDEKIQYVEENVIIG